MVFGPHMFNFPDISRWTIKEGAGKMVNNSQELAAVLSDWLANPSVRDQVGSNGIAFLQAHKGAVSKNLELITKLPDN